MKKYAHRYHVILVAINVAAVSGLLASYGMWYFMESNAQLIQYRYTREWVKRYFAEDKYEQVRKELSSEFACRPKLRILEQQVANQVRLLGWKSLD